MAVVGIVGGSTTDGDRYGSVTVGHAQGVTTMVASGGRNSMVNREPLALVAASLFSCGDDVPVIKSGRDGS